MTWLIDLPGCWQWAINANHRDHRQVEARKIRHLREAAFYAAKAAKLPQIDRCTVTLVVYPPDRRKRDLGKLIGKTLKACVDGLRDAGCLRDDDVSIVTAVGEVHREIRKGGGLALLIQETP